MSPPAPPSSSRLLITGLGLLTPLGHGAFATFSKLLAGRTIADRTAALPPDVDPVPLVQAVGGVSLARHTADDPAAEMLERVAREAATEADVDLAGLATFIGTSKGAVSKAEGGTWKAEGRSLREAQALRWALGPHGYLSHRLAVRTGAAVQSHVVGACASSLIALDAARRCLMRGDAETALVVTAESALTPLFIHSYRRLGVLAPLDREGYRQRPLDAARHGFMLSELAAALVLRRVETPPAIGDLELLDTAVAGEAYDLIRPSPTMDALAHVARQLLADRAIDMLHPHAPGTAEHDPTELQVLADACTAGASPDVYACKGALGHGLGAAGLVALVLAALCLRTGRRPPMPWLTDPIADAALPLSASSPAPGRRTGTHACFAAGFGGTTAGAVIKRF